MTLNEMSFPPDPEPDQPRRKRGRPPGRKTTGSTTSTSSTGAQRGRPSAKQQLIRNIREEIQMYLDLAAMSWSLVDPECALVLSERTEKMADALADMIARSEWLVARFEQTTLLADITKLMVAIGPLGKQIYSHHIARGHDHEGAGVDVTQFPAYAGAGPLG